jgi:hypothetical protein
VRSLIIAPPQGAQLKRVSLGALQRFCKLCAISLLQS